jgi:hypothetical protein
VTKILPRKWARPMGTKGEFPESVIRWRSGAERKRMRTFHSFWRGRLDWTGVPLLPPGTREVTHARSPAPPPLAMEFHWLPVASPASVRFLFVSVEILGRLPTIDAFMDFIAGLCCSLQVAGWIETL